MVSNDKPGRYHKRPKELHCIEKNSGMDIAELQSTIGDKLCLWGHLDLDELNKASDPKLLQELALSLRNLALDRMFILGTTSSLFEGTNLSALSAVYLASAPGNGTAII